jgi:hypothetical protein
VFEKIKKKQSRIFSKVLMWKKYLTQLFQLFFKSSLRNLTPFQIEERLRCKMKKIGIDKNKKTIHTEIDRTI